MSEWGSFDGGTRNELRSLNSVHQTQNGVPETCEAMVRTVPSGTSWGAASPMAAVRQGGAEDRQGVLSALRMLAGEQAEEDQRSLRLSARELYTDLSQSLESMPVSPFFDMTSNPSRPALAACEARLSDSIVSLRALLSSEGPSATSSHVAASPSPEQRSIQVNPPRCSLSHLLACATHPP